MLKSMRLQNLRAFADTGVVEFSRLNIFIGPNNAGKTTFVSSIELLLKTLKSNAPTNGPLALSEMPAFASFDAAVRRHWSRNEKRPSQIKLSYKVAEDGYEPFSLEYICEADAGSNASRVSRATYSMDGMRAMISSAKSGPNIRRYSGKFNDESFPAGHVFFHGILPIFQKGSAGRSGDFQARIFGRPAWLAKRSPLEIVKPYRPAPRSYYVLDDPSIESEERELITYLANLWDADDEKSQSLRGRIERNLSSLGLTTELEVVRTVQKRGPTVLEIRVAPHSVRQKVTIADAGFGLSQALPLIVSEARLNSGSLIAYQPEVHLHPFAQSRLADLFAASVGRQNQVFVESHSPDLVLRLQILIAEGMLRPSDVAVFCFENKKGRPAITRIEFDKAAKPNVQWPAGFLDTSLVLARQLNASRLAKIAPK